MAGEGPPGSDATSERARHFMEVRLPIYSAILVLSAGVAVLAGADWWSFPLAVLLALVGLLPRALWRRKTGRL